MLIYNKSNVSYDKITLKWFDLFFQKYKIYKTKNFMMELFTKEKYSNTYFAKDAKIYNFDDERTLVIGGFKVNYLVNKNKRKDWK